MEERITTAYLGLSERKVKEEYQAIGQELFSLLLYIEIIQAHSFNTTKDNNMATIKFTDVTLTVSDSHLMTFTDVSGEVFRQEQCSSLADVLRETALFAISEYRETPADLEFSLIQAVKEQATDLYRDRPFLYK